MTRAEYAAWRRGNDSEGRVCEFDDRALYAKGLCWPHYKKFRKSGYVVGPPGPRGQKRATCVRCGNPRNRKKVRTERERQFCRECIQIRECGRCGSKFNADNTPRKFCADCSCDTFADYYSWWASQNREYFRTRSAKRRAIIRGADAEDFTHEEIFERDNWACLIPTCLYPGQPVDPALDYPHPRSPSLDHIIPINPKIGGQHTRENVRCSHLQCNAARRDARGEQLPLLNIR